MPRKWFIKTKSGVNGPFKSKVLIRLAREGKLKPNSAISSDGEKWVKAKRIEKLVFPKDSKEPTRLVDVDPESAPWYILTKSITGPLSFRKLKKLASSGRLKPNIGISQDQKRWVKAKRVSGLEFPTAQPTKENTQEVLSEPTIPDEIHQGVQPKPEAQDASQVQPPEPVANLEPATSLEPIAELERPPKRIGPAEQLVFESLGELGLRRSTPGDQLVDDLESGEPSFYEPDFHPLFDFEYKVQGTVLEPEPIEAEAATDTEVESWIDSEAIETDSQSDIGIISSDEDQIGIVEDSHETEEALPPETNSEFASDEIGEDEPPTDAEVKSWIDSETIKNDSQSDIEIISGDEDQIGIVEDSHETEEALPPETNSEFASDEIGEDEPPTNAEFESWIDSETIESDLPSEIESGNSEEVSNCNVEDSHESEEALQYRQTSEIASDETIETEPVESETLEPALEYQDPDSPAAELTEEPETEPVTPLQAAPTPSKRVPPSQWAQLREAEYLRRFGMCSHTARTNELGGLSVDVYVFPANDVRPFTTLVTSGLSDFRMTVPKGQCSPRAELILYVDEPKPEHVNLLCFLAQIPYRNNIGLHYGSMASHGDPPAPIMENSAMDGFVFMIPNVESDFKIHETMRLGDDSLQLLWAVPTSNLERQFLQQSGMGRFCWLQDKYLHPHLFTPSRPCYVNLENQKNASVQFTN